MTKQEELIIAIIHKDNNKLSELLKDVNIDPSEDHNKIIKYSYKNKYINIVKLLWNDKRVKTTLKIDDFKLYKKLMQQDIKNKVNKF
jgi:hypothetical protein